MVCPYCQKPTKVNNSRPRHDNFSVWRRRQCKSCLEVFTTIERPNISTLVALKTPDGRLQPLTYAELFIIIFKALGGSQSLAEHADLLCQTCIERLLKLKLPVITLQALHKELFAVLYAFQPLAGERFLLNEVKTTKQDFLKES